MRSSFRWVATLAVVLATVPLCAQVTPAAGYTPPDDTPAFKIGATIFGDYTYFGYAPLPPAVVQQELQALKRIRL